MDTFIRSWLGCGYRPGPARVIWHHGHRQRTHCVEQALAAGEGEGGAEVGSTGLGVGVSVGAQPQKFDIVEAHPGVLGEAQAGGAASINSRPSTAPLKVR